MNLKCNFCINLLHIFVKLIYHPYEKWERHIEYDKVGSIALETVYATLIKSCLTCSIVKFLKNALTLRNINTVSGNQKKS